MLIVLIVGWQLVINVLYVEEEYLVDLGEEWYHLHLGYEEVYLGLVYLGILEELLILIDKHQEIEDENIIVNILLILGSVS